MQRRVFLSLLGSATLVHSILEVRFAAGDYAGFPELERELARTQARPIQRLRVGDTYSYPARLG